MLDVQILEDKVDKFEKRGLRRIASMYHSMFTFMIFVMVANLLSSSPFREICKSFLAD